MRLFGLLVAIIGAPCFAQAPLFPETGDSVPRLARAAEPYWRIGIATGLSPHTFESLTALDVERAGHGPVSVGGRVWAMTGSLGTDDGGSMGGGGLDGLVRIGTRGRYFDLRAGIGAGVAYVWYSPGGIGCEPDVGVCMDRPGGFTGVRAHVPLPVGLDVYPLPGVGVGVEVRPALMAGPANVSSVDIGVRVRLAR